LQKIWLADARVTNNDELVKIVKTLLRIVENTTIPVEIFGRMLALDRETGAVGANLEQAARRILTLFESGSVGNLFSGFVWPKNFFFSTLQVIHGNIHLVQLVIFARIWLFAVVFQVWIFILNWELIFKAFFVDNDISAHVLSDIVNLLIFGTLRCLILQYVELTHLFIGRGNVLLSFVDCNRLLSVLPKGDSAQRTISGS
jgi:hypothetical protein